MPISRNLLVIIIIIFGGFLLFQFFNNNVSELKKPFSEFLNSVENDKVTEAVIKGREIFYSTNNLNQRYITKVPDFYLDLQPLLYEKGVHFRVENVEKSTVLLMILTSWFPVLLIIGVFLFVMKQMQGGNKIMSFGKSKAKAFESENITVTFKDVAGIEEAKNELDEIVHFLRDPSKFQKLGGRIPRGVLLIGQPGTGKTLLAKAIAGESNASFFSISGSEFVEMFVGVGASRVRDLFAQARNNIPCIIFIDEIDAVGRHRGSGMGGGNDEREQTLNQLLVEMDGFSGNEGVIIIAATNRPDVLDPALLRPGRFDRQVVVPLPDLEGRKKILEVHTRKINSADDLKIEVIAKGTPGFSGADLANLANEAALLAGRSDKSQVEMLDFEAAKDKIILGSERRSMVMPQKEKETTAYHEAGHAIVGALIKDMDPVHKVTIVPRGKALGVTSFLPNEEKYSHSKSQLLGKLKMMMGGRAAEEIIFKHFTTGASDDLKRAATIAHQMVCKWGMSEKVGPIHLEKDQSEIYLGRNYNRKKKISQKSAGEIDEEINSIVNNSYKFAMQLLQKNIKSLHKISKKLIEDETIDGADIRSILKENPAI